MRFVQARHFTSGPVPIRAIRLVCLHSMESLERPDTAENVAHWFAGDDAPQASAHYLIDADSIIQAVKDEDIAWAAPGANRDGIHIELAGKAAQTSAQWLDGYSLSVLSLAAALTADLCRKYRIPVHEVGASGLLIGARGITTHAAVSQAFKKSTHHDPGEAFPLNAFVEMVRKREIPT